MVQLLDRYRRLSDGKAFAIVGLGDLPATSSSLGVGRTITLEAEDGERVESQASTVRGHGRFEPIEE